jgi:putative endonuclease
LIRRAWVSGGEKGRCDVDSKVQRGADAEHAAADLLTAAGYEIVERNFRCKAGELDIIARDGDLLVFVEVRSRCDGEHGDAAEMVGGGKRRQVIRVARYYLAAAAPAFERCRFDVVAITAGQAIWLKDAFRVA